ncbi:MAG: hypothetical protein F4W96_09795 [Chloroflexi bacterium]|nr:hypothetical protein [Chloroflexota bacterium]
MSTIPQQLERHIATLDEGEVIQAKGLLHLGERAAIDQALSRFARKGRLHRLARGKYVPPIETRFGRRPPMVHKVIDGLSKWSSEPIVPSGGAAANALGLTTQVPVRPVYLSSGSNQTLHFGNLNVELQHAPPWQLSAPGRKAGDVIRALAWLGPHAAVDNVERLRQQLTAEEREELLGLRALMPSWLAEALSALADDL